MLWIILYFSWLLGPPPSPSAHSSLLCFSLFFFHTYFSPVGAASSSFLLLSYLPIPLGNVTSLVLAPEGCSQCYLTLWRAPHLVLNDVQLLSWDSFIIFEFMFCEWFLIGQQNMYWGLGISPCLLERVVGQLLLTLVPSCTPGSCLLSPYHPPTLAGIWVQGQGGLRSQPVVSRAVTPSWQHHSSFNGWIGQGQPLATLNLNT